jgi:hypothetical protein
MICFVERPVRFELYILVITVDRAIPTILHTCISYHSTNYLTSFFSCIYFFVTCNLQERYDSKLKGGRGPATVHTCIHTYIHTTVTNWSGLTLSNVTRGTEGKQEKIKNENEKVEGLREERWLWARRRRGVLPYKHTIHNEVHYREMAFGA